MTGRGHPSRFENVHAELVGAMKTGLSLSAAARLVGVAPRTAEGWCTRGRREPEGPYARFLADVEEARTARNRVEGGEMDERELRQAVAGMVRGGNVQAARLMFEMLRADHRQPTPTQAGDQLAALDELARARLSRRGGDPA